ncbi:zinc finger protein Xfin-like [Mytilus californianus]|uniref:zinc finger protein Xfin-like n=1 Tax=Mytilus californianus TaxID=6549 RepID=UPI0022456931|nr:zinc finger protein Xfin-like [Mytilus californianus]
MDGMLMEWEKMLPDPNELDDLDQSDIIDNDLSLFDRKNESPILLDSANLEDFQTTDNSIQSLKPRDVILEGKQVGEITQSSVVQDSAETLKLIDELNSSETFEESHPNVSKSQINEKEMVHDKTKNIDHMTTEPSHVNGEVKNGELKVTIHNEIQGKTCNGSDYEKSLTSNFENCIDSPLQISDVRTGDIPPEKEFQSQVKKSTLDETDENNLRAGEINKEHNNKDNSGIELAISNVTGSVTSSNNEHDEIPDELDASLGDKNNLSKNNNVLAKKKGHENKKLSLSDVSNETDINSTNSKKQGEITPNERNDNHQGKKTDEYNDFVMLAIKEEPMDYDDYAKPEEFMTNFYNDMDGPVNESCEGESNGQVDAFGTSCPVNDYTLTDTGLFQCVYCSVRLPSFEDFEKHFNMRHSTMYKCKYCGDKFYRSQELAIHCRISHSIEKTNENMKYRIKQSVYKTNDKNNKHTPTGNTVTKRKKAKVYTDEDGNQIYKCAYCSKKFSVQQAMASHVRNAHIYLTSQNKDAKSKKAKNSHGKSVKRKVRPETENSNPDKGNENEKDEEKNQNEADKETTRRQDDNKPVLPYRNMSFESDSSQIEESLANADCSLKRELKSNQIYHCSKCTKWFYREKQVVNHEKTCTGIKQEPVFEEMEQKIKIDVDNQESEQKHEKGRLVNQTEINDVELRIRSEITKKLREKMLRKKSKGVTIISKSGNLRHIRERVKPCEDNFLPKYFCKYCPSSFEEGKVMNLHLLKHLGDVVRRADHYKCKICKCLKRSTPMLLHLQQHTGYQVKQLYQLPAIPECSICGKPYLNGLRLKNHILKHGNNNTNSLNLDAVIKAGLVSSSIANTCLNVKNNENSSFLNRTETNSEHIYSDMVSSNGKNNESSVTSQRPVSLDDIPFQCGMCQARFPNSQYLLHHITLHMQGPYVFKIEVDKKDKNKKEKAERPKLTSGNIMVQRQSVTVPKATHKMETLKSIDISGTTSMTTPIEKPLPIIINMPDVKKYSNDTAGFQMTTGTICNTVNSIAQDHMYTTSILPQANASCSHLVSTQTDNDHDSSETESCVSSSVESLPDYDTDECKQMEKQANKTKKVKTVKRASSVFEGKKNVFISARVPNFKKCLDIASGEWFECPYCLFLCQTSPELELHMQNHNERKDLKSEPCPVCDRKFVSKWHLSRHIATHKQNLYVCAFCDESFATSILVMEHMAEVHQQ